MPSIMYHLTFAEEVLKNIQEKCRNVKLDKFDFLSGNLVPDLALDKKSSHYRMPASFQGFQVPNLKQARTELYDIDNSILLGMYCHLYLDYHFIETYLIPEFIWDEKQMLVINPRNKKSWPVEKFFAKPSKGGILYNGYTEINHKLISDGHIKMDTISLLPTILPASGLTVFDTRREKTWREELDNYLQQKVPYTGEALDYARLCNAISSIANKFVNEEL